MRRARSGCRAGPPRIGPIREQAADLIRAGRVLVSGQQATKSATAVDPGAPLLVTADVADENWASRGAHKLIGALDAFADVVVDGRRCLDAGASTGGFTDVLLRRGARRWSRSTSATGSWSGGCRPTSGCTSFDRTNVRTLTPDDIGGPVELIVADLSFISLGAGAAGPDRAARRRVPTCSRWSSRSSRSAGSGSARVAWCAIRRTGPMRWPTWSGRLVYWGGALAGVVASPLPGPSGNVEFFVHLRHDAADRRPAEQHRAKLIAGLPVEEGPS